MADLIAQGSEPHQRWRRAIPAGDLVVVGREAGLWSVPWDERISRRHVQMCWRGGRLEVSRLDGARNPVFFQGTEHHQFQLQPREHFVIGQTTFTLTDDQVHVSQVAPQPIREQTFSPQYLSRVRFRNADQRLEVLSRLPDVISGAGSDTELFVRLVNLLLAGIPRAQAVALVAIEGPVSDRSPVQVLHWDRRLAMGGDFEPSRHLILETLRGEQSVLHVWEGDKGTASAFTAAENLDWAFCTPVPGQACPGWALYVAGRFLSTPGQSPSAGDSTDLREDLKFTELVGATLNSLRQVRLLERKNTSLSQFFPPAVLQALAGNDPHSALEPRETDVSVLFCDLRGFSRRAERNADDLLGLLKRVSQALGVMTHRILEQEGVIGDFQGDAAMGFWGWPIAQPDTVLRACRAALAIRSEFESAGRMEGNPLADFRVGIGLASGRAVAGGIGTIDQLKVTVFGPVVNLASRLEGMTKLLRCSILVDQTTAAVIRNQVPPEVARIRRVAVVRPYGLESALEVSELLPPVSEYSQLTDEHLQAYESALDAFLDGHWHEALEFLHQVPPKDRVKDFLTVFIAQHNRTPPPNWDRVIPLESKG